MLNIISVLVIFNSILSKIVNAKHYRAHDPMPVIANTIGPYNNPTETYPVWIIFNLLFTHNLTIDVTYVILLFSFILYHFVQRLVDKMLISKIWVKHYQDHIK